MPRRAPVGRLRGEQDAARARDVVRARRERGDDLADLRRVDAPHPRVAEFLAGAARVVRDDAHVAYLGRHVVRRRLAVRVARGGDLELRAAHERVVELAGRAHRVVRNRAVMRGYEIHQAEAQGRDDRQRGDPRGVGERAVRLDQHVDGDRLRDAELDAGRLDERAHFGRVGRAADLRQRQVRGRARRAQDDAHVVAPVRVGNVVDTHADAPEAVRLAADERGDARRVLGLAADGRAVLAVERDVEDGTELGLQRERFEHQLLAARVMIAARQDRGRRNAFVQHFCGCERGHLFFCVRSGSGPA